MRFLKGTGTMGSLGRVAAMASHPACPFACVTLQLLPPGAGICHPSLNLGVEVGL